jgi:hypothetical protein
LWDLANKGWIRSHKVLSAYDDRDFHALRTLIASFGTLCVTPNTLTECSNLSRQIGGHARRNISLVLADIIRNASERHVGSIDVCEGEDFARLGLADAVLLALMNQKMTLLTADLDLYAAACAIAPDRTVNFNHLPHRGKIR